MSPKPKAWDVIFYCIILVLLFLNMFVLVTGMAERDARWVEYVNIFNVMVLILFLATS